MGHQQSTMEPPTSSESPLLHGTENQGAKENEAYISRRAEECFNLLTTFRMEHEELKKATTRCHRLCQIIHAGTAVSPPTDLFHIYDVPYLFNQLYRLRNLRGLMIDDVSGQLMLVYLHLQHTLFGRRKSYCSLCKRPFFPIFNKPDPHEVAIARLDKIDLVFGELLRTHEEHQDLLALLWSVEKDYREDQLSLLLEDLQRAPPSSSGLPGAVCRICLYDTEDDPEDPMLHLPCHESHTFHETCIKAWLEQCIDAGKAPTCPCDRQPLMH